MKKFFVFTLTLWISISALACDSYLTFAPKDPRQAALFKKDCEIQDRYQKVRAYFESLNINVADLVEYRALRLIDRYSYENGRNQGLHPSQIYTPAPVTWEVWDAGIRLIFGDDQLQNALFAANGFESKGLGFDHLSFSNFNSVLLKNSKGDVSRDTLENTKRRWSSPGTYRQAGDGYVGWTTTDPAIVQQIQATVQARLAAQAKWEELAGVSFTTIASRYNAVSATVATFAVPLSVNITKKGTVSQTQEYYVNYAPDYLVQAEVNWLNIFIKENLNLYRKGKPVLAPIQLSALVQKWLVTIHPFSDGNGRTSRAVQDVILANFKMPYAPGGDLQNDVLAQPGEYVDQTYAAIESMLKKLESCAKEYEFGRSVRPSYGCRTVTQF